MASKVEFSGISRNRTAFPVFREGYSITERTGTSPF
jgi:hypothetical protein